MAHILTIADAVVASLNAAEFSMEFTAARSYVPSFALSEIADLRVTVVPKGIAISRGTRRQDQHDYQIDVAVQQKLEHQGEFDADSAAELDPLMALVEEIADHFRGSSLDTDPVAACMNVENGPIYAQEHMREGRLFTSILTFTFRTWR